MFCYIYLQFTQAISDIVLSILLAALLSLVFESPALAIGKLLVRKSKYLLTKNEQFEKYLNNINPRQVEVF
jgi:peptidoglycan/LPS O-acetylase OafA/YrhL